jgi:hypothetical protein
VNKQQHQDHVETFSTVHGKRVLEELKKLAHFNVAYVPKGSDGHIDIYEMCREEGKRAVIVHIERILNTDVWKE